MAASRSHLAAAETRYGSGLAVKSDLLQAKGDRAGARAALQAAIDAEPTLVNARLSMASLLIDGGLGDKMPSASARRAHG